MTVCQENRQLNVGQDFLRGLVFGGLCYLAAEWLVPSKVENPGDHDILLATRLGFIYPLVLSLWLGWLQRSWSRAIVGILLGIPIGLVYMWLCASRNFLAIMVGFPCLLGGAFAALVGSNRSVYLAGLGVRLGKGLLAGLTLGFVYMITPNIAGAMVMTPNDDRSDFTRFYISMMWRAGPIALGISSGIFFILIRWAVGLTNVKLLVFEEKAK